MDDIKRWYQGNRDKLSEHAKIEDLMYNWDILDIGIDAKIT